MNLNTDTVPHDLDSAVKLLKEALYPEEVARIKTLSPTLPGFHHNVGMWLRNNWDLWEKDTPLVLWFNTQKIYHADDMTGIIFESLWRDINDQERELDKQIAKCHMHWLKSIGRIDPRS